MLKLFTVDGISGSGKTRFGSFISDFLECELVSPPYVTGNYSSVLSTIEDGYSSLLVRVGCLRNFVKELGRDGVFVVENFYQPFLYYGRYPSLERCHDVYENAFFGETEVDLVSFFFEVTGETSVLRATCRSLNVDVIDDSLRTTLLSLGIFSNRVESRQDLVNRVSEKVDYLDSVLSSFYVVDCEMSVKGVEDFILTVLDSEI